MRILVRHGHFAFFPQDSREISRYAKFFGEEMVREGSYYTFANLADAPSFSIKGMPWMGLVATATFEGKPWDIMRENGFVYNVALGSVVAKDDITGAVSLPRSDNFFISPTPLFQPGKTDLVGNAILSYDAIWNQDSMQLRIRELQYE